MTRLLAVIWLVVLTVAAVTACFIWPLVLWLATFVLGCLGVMAFCIWAVCTTYDAVEVLMKGKD
jgi:uncharacterized membrane protein